MYLSINGQSAATGCSWFVITEALPSMRSGRTCRRVVRKGNLKERVTSLALGTGHNGWGCFVPDLTRLAALPCEEARHPRL